MTADRHLERRIANFYAAELPSQAPDRVLAEALATIEHTHQRRVLNVASWRFRHMSNFAKLAAAAVALVAVVAIGWGLYANNQGIGTQPTATPAMTPEPSPSPTATGLPLTQSFTSAFHGMTVDYPADWRVVAASAPWVAGLPGTSEESRDTIMSKDVENLFVGLASQLLAGRTGDEWIAEIFAHPDQDAPCSEADTEPVTVDGASGTLALCPERPLQALVADDERGYFIVFYGSEDRAWFEQFLATVQLDPAAAVEASASPSDGPLSQSFTSAIHGMSVDYPAGWGIVRSSAPWASGLPGTNEESRDTIQSNDVENLFIGLASQPLAGRSGDEWIAEISALPDWDAQCSADDTEPLIVDGSSGILALCPDRPLAALVADDQRGYFIVYYGSSDRAFFEQVLATVQLDPQAAVEPSASPAQ